MPNYDYNCKPCAKDFTVSRSMSDTSEVKCDTCGGTDTRRVWIAVAVTGKSSAAKGASAAPAPKPSGHGHCGTGGCC